MFDHDRSATRGEMATRGLYVFTHDNAFGKAPAAALFDRITIEPLSDEPPRTFNHYKTNTDLADLPSGITFTPLIG